MANVARPADRAQLLIVSAVGLAILLTALALALNTAVYAEIHVSETDNSLHEQERAVQYQDSVRRAVAGMIGSDAESVVTESELQANVSEWNELAGSEYARDGVATNASIASVSVENRIVHDDDTRVFTDDSGSSNWTVASNVTDVEGYEATINESDLAGTNDCASSDDCFTLTVDGDGGNAWQMLVYSSPSNQTVEIDVETAGGDNYNCKADAASAPVNVTGGVFVEADGSECTFQSFTEDASLDSPYTLRYENAGNASGTYNLSTTGPTIEDDERYGTDSPRIEPEVVAANVSISYQSPDLTYEAEIRVAPGDADG